MSRYYASPGRDVPSPYYPSTATPSPRQTQHSGSHVYMCRCLYCSPGNPNVSYYRRQFSSSPAKSAPVRPKSYRHSFSPQTSTPTGLSDDDECVADYRFGASSSAYQGPSYYVRSDTGADNHAWQQFPGSPHLRQPHFEQYPVPRHHAMTPSFGSRPKNRRRSSVNPPDGYIAEPIARPQTACPMGALRHKPVSTHTHGESPRSEAKRPSLKATPEDAKLAGIPDGYCLKHWDPSEEPILLLGSVFDSKSLGKWIYDWTVVTLGIDDPTCELAGELWLLLLMLSSKCKRAAKISPLVRSRDNKNVVEDFLAAGDRIMDKLRDLLARCEQPMLEAHQTDVTESHSTSKLGHKAGQRFIKTLFGERYELKNTQNLMSSISKWEVTFTRNVEPILKAPTL